MLVIFFLQSFAKGNCDKAIFLTFVLSENPLGGPKAGTEELLGVVLVFLD